MLEALERLVREVDRVSLVDEDMVRDSSRQHRGDRDLPVAGCDGRGKRALGGIAGSGVDEAPVPGGQPVDGKGRIQRGEREAGGSADGVAGQERQPVHERQRAVGGIDARQDIRHGHENREPGTPALGAVLRPESHPRLDDLGCLDASFEERQDGLCRDECDALLEPFL